MMNRLSEQVRELPCDSPGTGSSYRAGWDSALEKVAQLVEANQTTRVVCGYCDTPIDDTPEAFAAHDAACEHNPLVKRVADLEGSIRGLLACQDSLLSQLAWTPVEKGLPTEPGWYVFYRDNESAPDLLNLSADFWPSTKGWNDNFRGVNPDAPDWGYRWFRRITLPEAT
jgi:hypothetical protein